MNHQINRLLRNYKNARQSWECWCFMVNYQVINSNKNLRFQIDNNPLLFHLRYLAMKDYYIEAYKVLKDSNNNQDNIFALLRKHKDANPDIASEIQYHIDQLKSHEKIITRICNLRDKYYAHLDKNYNNHLDTIDLTEVLRCFDAIEKALVTLSSKQEMDQLFSEIVDRNDMFL